MRKLLTIPLAVLTCAPLSAQTNSVVAENVGNSGPLYYFHQRKVARALEGLLMVAWNDNSGAGGQVVYSIYDESFGTWSPAAAISAAGDRAIQPALAADDLGNIHATWQQRAASADKYQIWYSKYNGATWSTPVQISPAGPQRGEEATIEVGTDGTLWVAYNCDGEGQGNEWVLAVRSTDGGTTWSSDPDTLSLDGYIHDSITNGRVTLGAGPNGDMIAVWHDGQPLDKSRREIYANQYTGTSWMGMEMISDTTTVDRVANWYPTVAVDKQGNTYVIYHTNNVDVDRKLLLQKKAWSDPWSASVTSLIAIETAGDMLSTTAIADSNGVVHLAYRRDNAADDTLGLDEIAYTFTKDGGTSWSTPVVIGRALYDGGYVTIANRINPAYGVDLAWRESQDSLTNDQSTTAILYGNVPYSLITDVAETPVPSAFELLANYPNPFNPSTTIVYDVAERGSVRLTVFDLLGREVATLVEGVTEPGRHTIQWNGKTTAGTTATTGVYLARLTTSTGTKTLNMLLLK